MLRIALEKVNFDGVRDEISRIAVILEAYSQIIFDKRMNV